MRPTGLVDREADLDSVICKARELNPPCPEIIDFSCWEIRRTWCRLNHSNCNKRIIRTDYKIVL